MKLKISAGNSKLGRVSNLNLPPISTCVKDVPCTKDCYAMKSWRQYPNVRKAWQSNLDLYNEDPARFFADLLTYVTKKKPERFRLHSAGDMPDESYWYRFCEVANKTRNTKYLLFTKRYDYNLDITPHNVSLFLSTWPGLILPDKDIRRAWLEEDERKPEEYFRCVGQCTECNFSCWDTSLHDVVFPRH